MNKQHFVQFSRFCESYETYDIRITEEEKKDLESMSETERKEWIKEQLETGVDIEIRRDEPTSYGDIEDIEIIQ